MNAREAKRRVLAAIASTIENDVLGLGAEYLEQATEVDTKRMKEAALDLAAELRARAARTTKAER